MYVIGAYLMLGNITVGVVVGAVVALLLYLKKFFTEHIARLGEKDQLIAGLANLFFKMGMVAAKG